MGEDLAILSEGAWRTPLGDTPVDESLAQQIKAACPGLREDGVAHSREHSLEVEIPFLQILDPGFSFVPVAVGTLRFEELRELGMGLAQVLRESQKEILVVTSSDMNHYEPEDVTRTKDAKGDRSDEGGGRQRIIRSLPQGENLHVWAGACCGDAHGDEGTWRNEWRSRSLSNLGRRKVASGQSGGLCGNDFA
jgi:hypothetical protein